MPRSSSARLQLYAVAAALILIAGWRITYKVAFLGFEFFPDQKAEVWTIETRVQFDAPGGPVHLSLAVPEDGSGFRLMREDIASAGYGYYIDETEGNRRLIWTNDEAKGPQTLYYRAVVYDTFGAEQLIEARRRPPVEDVFWEEPYGSAARSVILSARDRSADTSSFARQLFKILHSEVPPPEANLLRQAAGTNMTKYDLELMLLHGAGIPARIARGIELRSGPRWQPLADLVDVYTDEGWQLFDPRTGRTGVPENFILMQRGETSVLDVRGGRNSSLRVSVIKSVRPAESLIPQRAQSLDTRFLDLSVLGLPVEVQTVYKLLSMIPLGIVIVVIFRNLIGIQTSGTFMPVLIALALLKTHLVQGMILFAIVIAAGLAVRAYLSRMNLLLVPRTAAAVIVVIITMMALSVASFHLGFGSGLNITYFPVIVLAWTIERASILWEEEGARNALRQLGASFLVAAAVQLCISSEAVQHLLFTFNELNLVFLAAVLLLGTYTGYRLTELRRFQPAVEE